MDRWTWLLRLYGMRSLGDLHPRHIVNTLTILWLIIFGGLELFVLFGGHIGDVTGTRLIVAGFASFWPLFVLFIFMNLDS